MTTAETVAALFHNDGLCWSIEVDGEERHIDEECLARGAAHYDDLQLGWDLYVFADASAIVTRQDAWDIQGALPYSGSEPEVCQASVRGTMCMEPAAAFCDGRGFRCEAHRDEDPED